MSDPNPSQLELRVLGPLEVALGRERVSLPRSKKSRALLAYLATTGRPHRRERLCSLFWEATDDPRGSLRWTLSRVRRVFGGEDAHIEADREQVAFRSAGVRIDAHALSSAIGRGLSEVSTDALEQLAGLPRGEFLEGLDLPDLLDFNAWCIAERERYRKEHAAVLTELVARLRDDPARALPHARQRAQVDTFDVDTQLALLRVLMQTDRTREARQRFDNVRRLYQEVGATGIPQLVQGWRALGSPVGHVKPAPAPVAPAPARERTSSMWPFVGRRRELAQLEELLAQATADASPRVALVSGEPGSGKSRLSERLMARASSAGFEVLSGRAYEAESTRPYGPWVDALQVEIDALVPSGDDGSPATRDAMFGAVTDRLATRAAEKAGVVLVLDDLQWLDRDSAELLHFVTRTYAGPLFCLLLARGGELADNEAGLRAIRSMRRDDRIVELEVEPLSREDISTLVGRETGVDVERVFEASAGNPLYAIELARAQAAGVERAESTVLQLVRERVEQLPDHAADVLRWCAVLGHAVDLERLEALSSLSPDEIVDALERLEHHALLRIDATRSRQRYVFAHDLVREAIYGELSHPRRRLMHRKVAHLLEPNTSDAAVATDVAHHARLAGEALLGVRACIVAGNQSLRMFANADAEALARRGIKLAQELDDAERIEPVIELLRVQYAARTPDREQAAAHVRALAERALDLGLTRAARLGFQTLSYLRWESASMAAAHDNIMQAERVSRSGDPVERTAALAQAAKCLVLLERNLGQAEAFAMEAHALVKLGGRSSSAVSFANGMIAAHRGEFDEAVEAFREAQQLAREHGERLAEFCAVEHWVMLEIDRGQQEQVCGLAEQLAELGGRVRPGAEAPSGRALLSFVRVLGGDESELDALRGAVEELRVVDAKYELSFLLTRWAEHALAGGDLEAAEHHAKDALEVARAIGRPSETALALVTLVRCGRARGDENAQVEHTRALSALARSELSQAARDRLEVIAWEG